MAPPSEYAVATALSSQCLSHDEGSVLVEAGGIAPADWFLDHGIRPKEDRENDEESEDNEQRPAKRRKVTIFRSVEAFEPQADRHIPVSRVTIDLHFPDTLNGKPAKKKAILEDVDFEDASAISVVPSIIDLFDDGTRLKLALRRKKGAVLMIDTAGISNRALDVLRKIAVSRVQSADKDPPARAFRHPATLPRCILTRSRGQLYTVLRLQATLYWQTNVSAFPSGVPTGKTKAYPDYDILAGAFPDGEREGVDHSSPWSPQDFYDSVHVPSKENDVVGDFEGLLESQLYPFQKRAVHWMLSREQKTYDSGELKNIKELDKRQDCNYYKTHEDLDGATCYVNHLQGTVCREMPSSATAQLRGGILAEEMGLGKTVEVLALLSLHPRPQPMAASVLDVDHITQIKPSKATLIITPNSILQQWMSELARHAPALKVMHYEGTSKTMDNERTLLRMSSNVDVVVTTYNVLAREVYFAEDPPDRNMRHARKFERKRSPLVQIEWWRLCLDEAQMVESGVTAAARVACRLPRVNSWAVSGTPLRKDVQDLLGLLIFLRYQPFNEDGRLWPHLINYHRHLFRTLFGEIALRHTKAQIREDLQLPSQKRVVITVPFTAVEQQHYTNMFNQMCEAVGVHNDGSPRSEEWDPNDPATIQEMRDWLVRLRQTCLHPQVGGRNRKALGRGQGPLRTVAEVLEVMIDHNETALRVEERSLLSTQLVRAHILGNAKEDEHRSEKALEIYLAAMKKSEALVREARQKLTAAKAAQAENGEAVADTDNEEDSSSESTPVLGRLRNNLRTSLQLQHACTFFAATAYYQVKANETLTAPESEDFRALEDKETSMYEQAKGLRKEILKDNSRKSENLMRKIDDLAKNNGFTKMPKIRDLESLGGIESRRIMEKSDDLCDVIRELAGVITEWRTKMAEYLLKPLVDKDEVEITGDEYEDSTKQQDELYAYFDAIKAMQADLNTFISAEETPLIDHEMKSLTKAAKAKLDPDIVDDMKTDVHAPELTLELLKVREKFRLKKKDVGSVKGLIQEARSLEGSLGLHENGTRAVEREIVHRHLNSLQRVLSDYTKASSGLEKEVELFRNTQNQRIEFYRQLQELSDTVAPYKEDLDEQLDAQALGAVMHREEEHQTNVCKLTSKQTFLTHLRTTNASTEPRICTICQTNFETGVLTVCGHSFCKDCILEWWKQSKTCPECRRKLSTVDFHNVTYKTQELRAQEETHSGLSSPAEDDTPSPSRNTSIYSDADNQLMQEIKAIDLPASYGTKIDTLGRHLHWIREHDPGAKSIVFSQYREFLTVLGTALKDFKIGYSRLGAPRAVERFKSDPSVDCLLLDAKTDSSGMTLVNATHVFICEPLIQTAVELQAIARVHRIGQTRPTTVWMYLINDTVEEAIYEISVARRLAHVQARQPNRAQKSRSATPAPLAENAIDAANSEELQAAPISKLLVNSKSGGEVVKTDDLWQCLFGKSQKTIAKPSVEMEMVVARHLRADAAENRRVEAT